MRKGTRCWDPTHHIDLIEADECLEQAHICLGQFVACDVALLAQSLLAPIQGCKQVPAHEHRIVRSPTSTKDSNWNIRKNNRWKGGLCAAICTELYGAVLP